MASTALPLARVRQVASEERLTEVYYNEMSRVVSFAPSASTAIGIDGVASDALTRVNVYYTTGTVATCLQHPRHAHPTQLFRRHVTIDTVRNILHR